MLATANMQPQQQQEPPAGFEFRPYKEFLKHYKLGRVLGQGAFGVVRKCRHRQTKKEFALKSVDASDKCIRQEARVLLQADLSHENIIECYGVYECEHEIHLLLEYCRGGDIQTYADRMTCANDDKHAMDRLGHLGLDTNPYCQPLPIDEIEESVTMVVAQLLRAVQHCHEVAKVAHRDLKPRNILMKERGDHPEIRLVDFGFASARSHSRVGTVSYASPEVVGPCKKKSSLKAADMWSVGAVVYSLLYGRPPFVGSDDEEIMQQICNADLKFCDDSIVYSDDAKDFLIALLQKDPSQRLSATEALSHEWIRSSSSPPLLSNGESSSSIETTFSVTKPKSGLLKSLFSRRNKSNVADGGLPTANQ